MLLSILKGMEVMLLWKCQGCGWDTWLWWHGSACLSLCLQGLEPGVFWDQAMLLQML